MNYPDFFTLPQLAVLIKYEKLLAERGKVMNLTAITDHDEVFEKHFIDSVLPLRFFELSENAAVVDVGSGAGFPGVPLKIVRPDISLTCFDSTLKKIGFLRELSSEIGIDFAAENIRAEEAGQSDLYREHFDVAVSRAVAALPVLLELCLPLVKVGGVFAAFKGEKENIDESAKAAEKLGAKIKKSEKYSLPSGDRRQLFVFEKIKNTPAEFPREYSKIKNKAL
ncbi:MAG: 16S rRNA (guanine(527)-N(7))-methyltransferase RsmG [Ruminococcus sp.]|jgi:16S rRNA (guanine527-N7)-methyltransferase|nr:16S rRNA (guanine(527)-N(7))-methyltransferase RsmG [Ruminococcus sp.]